MDPITISIMLAVGFAAGYGVRDWKSRKRTADVMQDATKPLTVFGLQ